MMPPYVMARTSSPCALVKVYNSTGLPCGVLPNASFFIVGDPSAKAPAAVSRQTNKEKVLNARLRKFFKRVLRQVIESTPLCQDCGLPWRLTILSGLARSEKFARL